jgi:hypothetical protein
MLPMVQWSKNSVKFIIFDAVKDSCE